MRRLKASAVTFMLLVSWLPLAVDLLSGVEQVPPLTIAEDNLSSYFYGSSYGRTGQWQVILTEDTAEKRSGENSLKISIVPGGTGNQPIIIHRFRRAQDFSMFSGIEFDFYGQSTNRRLNLNLIDANWKSNRISFTDTTTGWTTITVPFTMDVSAILRIIVEFPYDVGNVDYWIDGFRLVGGPTGSVVDGDWFPVDQVIDGENLVLNGSILLSNNNLVITNSVVRFNREGLGFSPAFEGGTYNITLINTTVTGKYPYRITVPASANLYVEDSDLFNCSQVSISGNAEVYNTFAGYSLGSRLFNVGAGTLVMDYVKITKVLVGVNTYGTGKANLNHLTVWNIMDAVKFGSDNNIINNSVVRDYDGYVVDYTGSAKNNLAENIWGSDGHEAFRVGHTTDGNTFRNCTGLYSEWAFVVQNDAKNVLIDGGIAAYCDNQGVVVENYNPLNVMIRDMTIHNNHKGIAARNNARNVTIDNCTFYDNQVLDIDFYGDATGTLIDIYTPLIRITGNAQVEIIYTNGSDPEPEPEPEPLPTLPTVTYLTFQSNSTVASIEYAGSVLSLSLSGPEGTVGFTEMQIAKSVNSVTDLQVVVNGLSVEYALSENGEYYLVRAEYQH